jgi:hypothetical protein
MPWVARQKRYWTVCWAWIIPYPCRKTKTVYCATGRWKQRCVLFYGKQWICVDGREYSYYDWCFGIGDVGPAIKTVCRDKVPDSKKGCDVVGDVPPGAPPAPGSGTSQALEMAASPVNITASLFLGAIVGFLITQILTLNPLGMLIGLIIGAILGGISGGSTRDCAGGCRRSLLSLLIILLIIWLYLMFLS